MWPMPAKTCFRAWIRRKTSNAFAACWGLMRVLFVCLGNICRSPTAEGVFRRKVEEAGLASRIHVDSAGTAGWHVGKAPDQRTRLAAQRRGYDLSALRGRQVGIEDFSRHDLILAMDLSTWLTSRPCVPGAVPPNWICSCVATDPSGTKCPIPTMAAKKASSRSST